MRLKVKCAFMMKSVEYLGHRISAEGLRPNRREGTGYGSSECITAKVIPRPRELLRQDVTASYYHSTLAPLYRLLQQKVKWTWGGEQKKAFQEAKTQLTSSTLLILLHYDSEKDLILSCEASPYGVGAVLSYRMEGGTEKLCITFTRPGRKEIYPTGERRAVDHLWSEEVPPVSTQITSHFSTFSQRIDPFLPWPPPESSDGL